MKRFELWTVMALLSSSGCAMHEVSPGHYVLGLDNAPANEAQGQAAAAPAPAPASAPAPAAGAPAAAAATPANGMPTSVTPIVPVASGVPWDDKRDAAEAAKKDASIKRDAANAASANVDLSVFGLQVAAPLRLPRCAPSADGSSAENCITEASLYTLPLSVAAARRSPEGTEQVYIQIGRDRCPDWLSFCLVSATIGNGAVYSVLARVSGAAGQEAVERRLTDKYHRAPDKSQVSECRNDHGLVLQKGDVRVWAMPGISVVYDPLAVGCSVGVAAAGSGLISIETQTLRDQLSEQKRSRETSQPKM